MCRCALRRDEPDRAAAGRSSSYCAAVSGSYLCHAQNDNCIRRFAPRQTLVRSFSALVAAALGLLGAVLRFFCGLGGKSSAFGDMLPARMSASLGFRQSFEAVLRRRDFCKRIPSVSSAASDRQDHPAMVRGRRGGVDRLPAFFQVGLLLGYFYAHFLSRISPANQVRIHAVSSRGELLALPILPKDSWRPAGPETPVLHILLLLTVTVGLPYFLLSSTSPLLQAWYRAREAGAALSLLCAFERRLAARAAQLSRPDRATCIEFPSGDGLVGGVRACRALLRAVGFLVRGEVRFGSETGESAAPS